MDQAPPFPRTPVVIFAALALFALAYALINEQQLVHRILYRLAAHDRASAILNFTALGIQALALLAATIVLPRRWYAVAFILLMISAGFTMGYQQVMGEPLDAPTVQWVFGERRLAVQAGATFLVPLAVAAAKWLATGALMLATRRLLYRRDAGRTAIVAAAIALIAAPLPLMAAGISTIGSERALYQFGVEVLRAEPPPPRAAVAIGRPTLADAPPVGHIVWLVDESIAYDAYARLVAPSLAAYRPIDFGLTAAMANCSSPANVAMRSGVAVDTVSPSTDLRATPSIWGYARHAGYRTIMIDGQVSGGAPQNLLLPPERALIDGVVAAEAGYTTDLEIAGRINRTLKTPGKSLTYAVLAGAHFQYRDHYPPGTIPAGSPLTAQYDAAVATSKRGFFDALLAGVDRDRVAIIYTSDHGQNVQAARPPHCSADPVRAEYEVPMVALVPPARAEFLAPAAPGVRSQSQIFPMVLWLMGYDRAEVERRTDNLPGRPTRAYVRFGRSVVPLAKGDRIDVVRSAVFPGD
ncbi:MAG: hypothetical protein GW859_00610 [Sphingomonadales bacterium]|nr:hypothetical protein [Sphingomonadales bacterium]